MTFWMRSFLVFSLAGLAMHVAIPFYLDRYVFAKMTFLPPVPGPEPEMKPFVSVAQSLNAAPDIPPEPTGAFRVDFSASITTGGDPKRTQETIDKMAFAHCDMLRRTIAATCSLESQRSTLRVGELDHNGREDATVFLRFLVTPKR